MEKTTIGRYQDTNRPIPIIGKTADTDYGLIIDASLLQTPALLTHLFNSTKFCSGEYIVLQTIKSQSVKMTTRHSLWHIHTVMPTWQQCE